MCGLFPGSGIWSFNFHNWKFGLFMTCNQLNKLEDINANTGYPQYMIFESSGEVVSC